MEASDDRDRLLDFRPPEELLDPEFVLLIDLEREPLLLSLTRPTLSSTFLSSSGRSLEGFASMAFVTLCSTPLSIFPSMSSS